MTVINIVKIICLVLLCTIGSFTDIKQGIIKNKFIIVFLCSAVLLNMLSWVFYERSIVCEQVINIIIVNAISLILYVFHIWAGGDCKLLFAISMLVPFNTYIGIKNMWASLSILMCMSFGISYVYLIFDSVKCSIRHKKCYSKQEMLQKIKNSIVKWAICVVYITLIDTVIIKFFSGLPSWFIVVINICGVLIISSIKALCNKYIIILTTIVGITLKVAFGQQLFDKFSLLSYFVVILSIALKTFIDEYNYNIIETSQVKKGMILSLVTTIQFANSKVKGLPQQSSENLKSRLSEDEVEAIKKWEKSKYGSSTIQIVRKIPFAVFISLGAVSYIVVGVIIR